MQQKMALRREQYARLGKEVPKGEQTFGTTGGKRVSVSPRRPPKCAWEECEKPTSPFHLLHSLNCFFLVAGAVS